MNQPLILIWVSMVVSFGSIGWLVYFCLAFGACDFIVGLVEYSFVYKTPSPQKE